MKKAASGLRILKAIDLWKGVQLCTTQSRLLTTLKMKSFENIVEKGESAGKQHFFLFTSIFSTISKTNFIFSFTFILSSTSAFNLDLSKNLLFDKELTLFSTLFQSYHGS